ALIMVLTFTCSFSVADAGREEVRTMLVGALGCNFVSGIIDAVFYLMACFSAQGHGILTLGALRQVSSPAEAHQIIAQALPPVLVSVLSSSELEIIRQKLNQMPDLPRRPRLKKEDCLGALGVFLIVVLATLPVVIPFALIADAKLALRTSSGIVVVMLFLTGYAFGRYAGYRPRKWPSRWFFSAAPWSGSQFLSEDNGHATSGDSRAGCSTGGPSRSPNDNHQCAHKFARFPC